MFECVVCSNRYTLDDVKTGEYMPSTSVCLNCYKQMRDNKSSCFASDKYDIQVLACQECSDNRHCRAFVKHRKAFR